MSFCLLFICLYVCLCDCLPVNNCLLCLSDFLCPLSVCITVCQFMSFSLVKCVSVYLYVCLVYMSFRLFICMSLLCLSVYISFCLFLPVCRHMSVCLYACLKVFMLKNKIKMNVIHAHIFLYLSNRSSVRPFVRQFISVWTPVYCLSDCLYVCPSVLCFFSLFSC